MSGSESLLSEQSAFANHLFIQGYPLWTPDPVLLPQSQQNVGLRIGDVGTVDEKGRFDVFFNILDPLGNADHILPGLQPFAEDDVRCPTDDILSREVVSSPETYWEADQLDILTDQPGITRKTTQYSATLSNDGSHIILPQGAQSFDLALHYRRRFERHARVHGAEWLEQYKDRLGCPRSNSLYLLTGFHRTCSWSIASFGMQTAANTDPVYVYCTTVEVDERIIRHESVWHPTGRFKRKIGPAPDRQGHDNQTVFIRGITITPNLHKQSQTEQQQAGLLGMLSSPTQLFNTLMGDSGKTQATASDTSDVTIQYIPRISQVTLASEIINQYLFKLEPSANIAVTHDSQWMKMLGMLEKGQPWTLKDLENHLEEFVPEHYFVCTYDGTAHLNEKEKPRQGVEAPDFSVGIQQPVKPDWMPPNIWDSPTTASTWGASAGSSWVHSENRDAEGHRRQDKGPREQISRKADDTICERRQCWDCNRRRLIAKYKSHTTETGGRDKGKGAGVKREEDELSGEDTTTRSHADWAKRQRIRKGNK